MDDFLENYEVLGGRKLRQVLPGATNIDKLQTMRDGFDKDSVQAAVVRQSKQVEKAIPMPVEVSKEDRWDCETILSKFVCLLSEVYSSMVSGTYSNLENHPKLIRVRDLVSTSSGPKISLNKKTGMPALAEEPQAVEKAPRFKDSEESDEESDDTSRREFYPLCRCTDK